MPRSHEEERRHQLKYKFKMTPKEYAELLLSQDGVCAICGKASTRTLHVDHDRSCCPQTKPTCGRCRRGLLCTKCNVHLAWVEDKEWHEAALSYIKEYGG